MTPSSSIYGHRLSSLLLLGNLFPFVSAKYSSKNTLCCILFRICFVASVISSMCNSSPNDLSPLVLLQFIANLRTHAYTLTYLFQSEYLSSDYVSTILVLNQIGIYHSHAITRV